MPTIITDRTNVGAVPIPALPKRGAGVYSNIRPAKKARGQHSTLDQSLVLPVTPQTAAAPIPMPTSPLSTPTVVPLQANITWKDFHNSLASTPTASPSAFPIEPKSQSETKTMRGVTSLPAAPLNVGPELREQTTKNLVTAAQESEQPTSAFKVLYSPTFQMFTSLPFYTALLDDLRAMSEYADQLPPSCRDLIWAQLFELIGVKHKCSNQFTPIINAWASSGVINILAIELLYLSFQLCIMAEPTLLGDDEPFATTAYGFPKAPLRDLTHKVLAQHSNNNNSNTNSNSTNNNNSNHKNHKNDNSNNHNISVSSSTPIVTSMVPTSNASSTATMSSLVHLQGPHSAPAIPVQTPLTESSRSIVTPNISDVAGFYEHAKQNFNVLLAWAERLDSLSEQQKAHIWHQSSLFPAWQFQHAGSFKETLAHWVKDIPKYTPAVMIVCEVLRHLLDTLDSKPQTEASSTALRKTTGLTMPAPVPAPAPTSTQAIKPRPTPVQAPRAAALPSFYIPQQTQLLPTTATSTSTSTSTATSTATSTTSTAETAAGELNLSRGMEIKLQGLSSSGSRIPLPRSAPGAIPRTQPHHS
eukprot:TRINITY_DN2531_c1_g1_i1.p1 TRINITY_DN2531_c1_g1~~TRINITY_DN2531_c1_g1_i1.p1  ORF type:complete len:585 (-),score=80.46 TRINITY_DN2531_c1_g1_i1:56-1810(-)